MDAALFSSEEAKDKLGDDLLGVLTGAIDVVATGDDDWEVVRSHVCLVHGNFVRHTSGGVIHVKAAALQPLGRNTSSVGLSAPRKPQPLLPSFLLILLLHTLRHAKHLGNTTRDPKP